jgi:hypothetical protein
MIKRRILAILSIMCLAGDGCGGDGSSQPAGAAGADGFVLADPAQGVVSADLSCEDNSGGSHECVEILDLSIAEQLELESECTVVLHGTVRHEAGSCPTLGKIGSCVSPIDAIPGKSRRAYYYDGDDIESAKSVCASERGVFE